MKTQGWKWSFMATIFLFVALPTAQANEKGDWLIRAGAGFVDPKSNNGSVASVDSGVSLVFNGTYFLSDNLALEVLASAPFSHDIMLVADGSTVGETKHLPPTVSLQYHFNSTGDFHPYVGAGFNYTLFFDERTEGALAGSSLELDPSFGVAAQVGFDYDLTDQVFLNLDVRWANIESDAELDGAVIETVEIDPLVYSLVLGWRF